MVCINPFDGLRSVGVYYLVAGHGLAPFSPYSSNISSVSLPRLNGTFGTVHGSMDEKVY